MGHSRSVTADRAAPALDSAVPDCAVPDCAVPAAQASAAIGQLPNRATPSVWRPVRGGNALEITVARLVQAIRLGIVAAGERLPPERALAKQLQVSRVTLREALAELREAGFLVSRRGRGGGTFVVWRGEGATAHGDAAAVARKMGESLHDALDFRRVLEGGAAALAAMRALTVAQRAHLIACLHASRGRDPATRRINDSRLHLAIAAASGSPSLSAAIADVQLTLDRLLAAIPVLRRNLDHSDTQHTRIVEAILAADGHTARMVMEEHCDGTAELLRGLLT